MRMRIGDLGRKKKTTEEHEGKHRARLNDYCRAGYTEKAPYLIGRQASGRHVGSHGHRPWYIINHKPEAPYLTGRQAAGRHY
jgi:hypothetical protein